MEPIQNKQQREPGYIKLWRKTLSSGILKNPTAWQVFGYLLLKAAWEKYGFDVKLEPGQLIVGRRIMAKDLETTENKIRAALKLLSEMNIISIQTTNNYSIITLKNWKKYQEKYQETDDDIQDKETKQNPTKLIKNQTSDLPTKKISEI
jgi:DNA-binding transcriptional regulator YhcF (GntR family)